MSNSTAGEKRLKVPTIVSTPILRPVALVVYEIHSPDFVCAHNARHLSLAPQPAFGAHLAGDTRHLGCEAV
jgi:hypothetical protein